jgi:hypothetical protein
MATETIKSVMNVSSVTIEYLRIEPETVLEVSDKVLIAIQQYGLRYIEFDSTLTTGCQSSIGPYERCVARLTARMDSEPRASPGESH